VKAWGAIARRNRGATLLLVACVAVFTTVGLVRGIWFVWIYLPALVASTGIVVAIDQFRGPIPESIIWLLVVWAGLHLAGGLLPNPSGDSEILYGLWLVDGVLRYDQVVHGFGIGAATAALAYAARDSDRPLVWGFVLAQVVGGVNETAENIFAVFVEDSNVGDIVNTIWDLTWHLIGSAIAVYWMARRGIPGRVAEDGFAGPAEAAAR
jgi:hypothetical protein